MNMEKTTIIIGEETLKNFKAHAKNLKKLINQFDRVNDAKKASYCKGRIDMINDILKSAEVLK